MCVYFEKCDTILSSQPSFPSLKYLVFVLVGSSSPSLFPPSTAVTEVQPKGEDLPWSGLQGVQSLAVWSRVLG